MSDVDALIGEYGYAYYKSFDPQEVGSTCRLIRAESALRDFISAQRDEIARLTVHLSDAIRENSFLHDTHDLLLLAKKAIADLQENNRLCAEQHDRTQKVLEETVDSMGDSIVRIEAERDEARRRVELMAKGNMTLRDERDAARAEADALRKDAERAIHLYSQRGYAIVAVEHDKRWVEVMREQLDGAFSHIIEPLGIRKRIDAAIAAYEALK